MDAQPINSGNSSNAVNKWNITNNPSSQKKMYELNSVNDLPVYAEGLKQLEQYLTTNRYTFKKIYQLINAGTGQLCGITVQLERHFEKETTIEIQLEELKKTLGVADSDSPYQLLEKKMHMETYNFDLEFVKHIAYLPFLKEFPSLSTLKPEYFAALQNLNTIFTNLKDSKWPNFGVTGFFYGATEDSYPRNKIDPGTSVLRVGFSFGLTNSYPLNNPNEVAAVQLKRKAEMENMIKAMLEEGDTKFQELFNSGFQADKNGIFLEINLDALKKRVNLNSSCALL